MCSACVSLRFYLGFFNFDFDLILTLTLMLTLISILVLLLISFFFFGAGRFQVDHYFCDYTPAFLSLCSLLSALC